MEIPNLLKFVWFMCNFVLFVDCGDFIPDRKCGSLFSAKDSQLESDAFILKDFDQSVNTQRDYRASINGWQTTTSIEVEQNCIMNICNGTYFTGTCIKLSPEDEPPSSFIENIRSINCTCKRECTCENVVLQYNEYGRGYLKGGCRTCNTEYFAFNTNATQRFFTTGIEALVIRRGCNLTLYSETLFENIDMVISSEIYEDVQRNFKSYRFTCDESAFFQQDMEPEILNSSLIRLPDAGKETIRLFWATTDNNTGLNFALASLSSGRSWKNAFILLIGTPPPEYCELNGTNQEEGMIGECQISIDLSHLGISNTGLRFIFYTKTENQPFRTSEEFYQLTASLDEYFSTHGELKYAIPTAVIIQDRLEVINGAFERSSFQKKLQMLNALRTRVLDENYSNVVFLFEASQRSHESRNIETALTQFEIMIKKQIFLPKPFFAITQSDLPSELTKVNGYWISKSCEYWGRSLEENLKLIAEKSGDELGLAILKASIVQVDKPVTTIKYFPLVPANHSKVGDFLDYIARQEGKIKRTNLFALDEPVFSESAARMKAVKMLDVKCEGTTALLRKIINDQGRKMKLLEARLSKEIEARESDSRRIKDEVLQMVREDLNKLFE